MSKSEQPRILGAVGINGTVYRAGQEADLQAASAAAGVDLTDKRFAGVVEGFTAPKAKSTSKSDTSKSDTSKSDAKGK